MGKKLTDIQEITGHLLRFRDERDWEQFHTSKDLALALSIEAAELNELFLWKMPEEADSTRLREELADVLIFAFLLAAKHNLNIREIMLEKIAANERKYPAEKVRGKAQKYPEYDHG